LKKNKTCLFVLPDYTHSVLSSLKEILESDFTRVLLVVPASLDSFIFRKLLFKNAKVSARRVAWMEIKSKPGFTKVEIIHVSTLFFAMCCLYRVIIEGRNHFIPNTLRWIIERKTIRKVEFNDVDFLYSFDTASVVYQRKAVMFNVISIMESRGCYVEYVNLVTNSKNECIKNNSDLQWEQRMIDEVSNADFIIGYSKYHMGQFRLNAKTHAILLSYLIRPRFTKKTKVKISEGCINFFYLGRITENKGIKLLLDAWILMCKYCINESVNLYLVGDLVDEELLLGIRTIPKVQHIDRLNSNELCDFLEEVGHVLVFPTHFDSYGMVVPEALSFNIPIITSSRCGAAEILSDDFSVVIDDVSDPRIWADAMFSFVSDPMKLNKMSDNINRGIIDYGLSLSQNINNVILSKFSD
jgi:glycosyltransferase involved in cell wall biosynthesis